MGLNQRTISVVVLIVLAALPLSGALCALVCDSATMATVSAHHGAGKLCDKPPSTGAQIHGTAGHDCSTHDVTLLRAPSTVAERADGVTGSVLLARPTAVDFTNALSAVDSFFDDDPPGTAPLTTIPLVLRV